MFVVCLAANGTIYINSLGIYILQACQIHFYMRVYSQPHAKKKFRSLSYLSGIASRWNVNKTQLMNVTVSVSRHNDYNTNRFYITAIVCMENILFGLKSYRRLIAVYCLCVCVHFFRFDDTTINIAVASWLLQSVNAVVVVSTPICIAKIGIQRLPSHDHDFVPLTIFSRCIFNISSTAKPLINEAIFTWTVYIHVYPNRFLFFLRMAYVYSLLQGRGKKLLDDFMSVASTAVIISSLLMLILLVFFIFHLGERNNWFSARFGCGGDYGNKIS